VAYSTDPVYENMIGIPTIIKLDIGERYNGINNKLINVGADGNFSEVIYSEDFKKPQNINSKYEDLFSVTHKVYLGIPEYEFHRRIDGQLRFKSSVKSYLDDKYLLLEDFTVKEYFVKTNSENIKTYVSQNINSKIFPIKLSVNDNVKRTPVDAKVVITCISYSSFDALLQKEFGKSTLIKEAKKYIYFFEKDTYTNTASSLIFDALEGARYKIEFYNDEYVFFETEFIAQTSEPELTALIVEKGILVRLKSKGMNKGKLVVKKK